MRHHLSVVVPAFNEGQQIGSTVERMQSAFRHTRESVDVEIVLVDDGSRDDTATVLRELSDEVRKNLRIITHEKNRGLTEAIKTGVRHASHETVVILDADLSYDPQIVERLFDTRETTDAAIVIASPYMIGGHVANVPYDRLAYSRIANYLLSICVGGRIKTFTGMVRAYDRDRLLPILERPCRGEFNAWLVSEVMRTGAPIVEIPAALVWPAHRTCGPSRLSLGTLFRRARLVVESLAVLIAARRFAMRQGNRS